MGKILLFQVNIIKANQVIALGKKLGHLVEIVPSGDFGKSLGAVAGIPGIQSKPQTQGMISSEMMVFSGIDSKQLDVFLAAYKEAGISPIERKAVLTPTNVKWSGYQLFAELDEHAKK